MHSAILFICFSLYLLLVFNSVGNMHVYFTPPPPSRPLSTWVSYNLLRTKDVSTKSKTVLSVRTIFLLLFIISYLIFLQYQAWLYMCKNTHYIQFDTNLNVYKKNKENLISPLKCPYTWISLVTSLAMVLLSEIDFLHFCIAFSTNFELRFCFELIFYLLSKFRKTISRMLFMTSVILVFSTATTPNTQYVCIAVLKISSISFTRKSPPWLLTLLILISNDIEQNPGPGHQSNYLNFMNWNLNSLATNNFSRLQIIEAHNSVHKYDLISICETSLTNSLATSVPELDGYTFEPANHPDNVTHGGVGLFYKNSLPIVVRRDLSFSESIVIELKLGRKRIFFTVLYRSPSFSHTTPEFQDFMENFRNLHSNIKAENPFAMFFTGDFNGHSQLWWPDGDTNPEGREIEDLFNFLNLSQVISEPTNFTPGCLPSCIDLIATDQPNLILDSGTRASLDPKCHHQIIYCKINFKIPPLPPSERKIWHSH